MEDGGDTAHINVVLVSGRCASLSIPKKSHVSDLISAAKDALQIFSLALAKDGCWSFQYFLLLESCSHFLTLFRCDVSHLTWGTGTSKDLF